MIGPDETGREIPRWAIGIGFAAALHLCGALVLVGMRPPEPAVVPVMMLELAPLSQAPDVPSEPQPEAPSAEAAPAEAATVPEPPVAQPPPADPEPAQPEAAVPDEPASETPKPESAAPAEASLAKPAEPPVPGAALALPVPPPPPPAQPTRPAKHVVPRHVARPAPAAPVQADRGPMPPARQAAAPAPSAAHPSAQATADWRARLLAHLNRFKRYPPMALMRRVQGVAFIHLVLMPDGSARDVRLQTGSGAAILDEEALALIARAQPMPVPPEAGPTELILPVQFAVR